jgi:hypothetical protein
MRETRLLASGTSYNYIVDAPSALSFEMIVPCLLPSDEDQEGSTSGLFRFDDEYDDDGGAVRAGQGEFWDGLGDIAGICYQEKI